MGLSNSKVLQDVIVFSVYRTAGATLRGDNELSEEENKINHILAESVLIEHSIPYAEGEGVYLGDKEQCFICVINSIDDELVIESLCKQYNQECYLKATQHKHGLRKAFFVYPYSEASREESFARHTESVGYLREVRKEVALRNGEGYTYRPDVDKYWIITADDNTTGA